MSRPERRTVIVTSSWDDGHSMDLRLAEMLHAYGVRGTFYVAFNHPKSREISDEEIRAVRRLGMEIGSHTLSHKVLTTLGRDAMRYDLKRSKELLEEILGEEVCSLSYPLGLLDAEIYQTARDTGYRVGRTSVAFRTAPRFDPLRMPITHEFYPYSRTAILRHALRDANLGGIATWMRCARMSRTPEHLARRLFDRVLAHGGIYHVNARSWEIDQFGLWDALERTLEWIGRREGVLYLTNAQVAEAVAGAGGGGGADRGSGVDGGGGGGEASGRATGAGAS